MEFCYKFYAIEGVQAKRNYYIAMVPLKILTKLIGTDNEYVLPEYRAQRKINETRIPEITKYIIDNRDNYVFSALSASIDGHFTFKSIENNAGILEVDMNATFLLNDGQHRKAAIEEALREDQSLADETISVVFFEDQGLKRSQQMFSDLNKHAVKTSNSLSTLYDSRDILAVYTTKIIEGNPFLNKYTDKEKDNLGKNSSKLFTLNSFYKSNQRIVGNKDLDDQDYLFLKIFWDKLVCNITEWQDVEKKTITKRDLRENYIITLSLILNAFGKLGHYFYNNREIDMEKFLPNLRKIDWARTNSKWMNVVLRDNGKVLNNEQSISMTYNIIKNIIME